MARLLRSGCFLEGVNITHGGGGSHVLHHGSQQWWQHQRVRWWRVEWVHRPRSSHCPPREVPTRPINCLSLWASARLARCDGWPHTLLSFLWTTLSFHLIVAHFLLVTPGVPRRAAPIHSRGAPSLRFHKSFDFRSEPLESWPSCPFDV